MSQSFWIKLSCLVAAAICNLAIAVGLQTLATSEPTAAQLARSGAQPAVVVSADRTPRS